MKTLEHIIQRNLEWANTVTEKNPQFFSNLASQQNPEYLWIGCSDSRVPANQIMDLPPGEVFVHRNIANVVVHTDLNCLSVIQYAVEVLKVKHIIVGGHYGCGGIKAAMDGQQHGLIDNWLGHIKDTADENQAELDTLNPEEKAARLCELNVIKQADNVRRTSIYQAAEARNQEVKIHSWIYSLRNGKIKVL